MLVTCENCALKPSLHPSTSRSCWLSFKIIIIIRCGSAVDSLSVVATMLLLVLLSGFFCVASNC